ncbi:hypothetical protein MMC09_004756 [Bachmanniomyces sp. S44760]|nr:hypothetical protein [Bachmanniomyces sp. S44760]
MTNILLITSLISLLSNSLTKVMDHAKEEYLFQYSVFVLEASASRRLTYYFPPLNLLPLVFFRPLRLCVPADRMRSARITLLKATHLPYVIAIWAYETVSRYVYHEKDSGETRTLSQKRPMFEGRVSSSRKAGLSALRSRSEVSLVGTPTADARPKSAGPNHDLSDLKQIIHQLSRQVDELSSRLD